MKFPPTSEIKPVPKYDFNADLALGKSFEQKFKEFLTQRGVLSSWIRLAPDKQFKEWDVKLTLPDIVLEEQYFPGKEITYEIKRDRHMARTGNICVETYSCSKKKSLGWLLTTKAHFIVFFFEDDRFVYFKTEDIRDAWFDNPSIWKKELIKQTWGTTVCWLTSIHNIKHKMVTL